MVQQVVVGHIYEQTGVSGALAVLLLWLKFVCLYQGACYSMRMGLFVFRVDIERFVVVNIIAVILNRKFPEIKSLTKRIKQMMKRCCSFV